MLGRFEVRFGALSSIGGFGGYRAFERWRWRYFWGFGVCWGALRGDGVFWGCWGVWMVVLGVFGGHFMGCWGRLGVLGAFWNINIHVRCVMKYR